MASGTRHHQAHTGASLLVPCRPGTPIYKFQDKTRSGACAGPCLLAKVGSGITMCLVALDPTSLIGRALASPHV
jgi:hypothetical protein